MLPFPTSKFTKTPKSYPQIRINIISYQPQPYPPFLRSAHMRIHVRGLSVCLLCAVQALLNGKYYTFRKVFLTPARAARNVTQAFELKLVLIGNLVNFKPIYMQLVTAHGFVYTLAPPRSD